MMPWTKHCSQCVWQKAVPAAVYVKKSSISCTTLSLDLPQLLSLTTGPVKVCPALMGDALLVCLATWMTEWPAPLFGLKPHAIAKHHVASTACSFKCAWSLYFWWTSYTYGVCTALDCMLHLCTHLCLELIWTRWPFWPCSCHLWSRR